MDEIVKNHLKSGLLLSPQLYELARENDGQLLVMPNGTVATQGIITKQYNPTQREYTPQELSTIYTERFKVLSAMLKDKIKPTSIDKLRDGKVETIGVVRDGILEDLTGSIKISFSGQLLDDEILGIRGRISGGILKIDEVIYPDVPLSNKPKYSQKKTLLCLSFDEADWKIQKAKEKESFFIKIQESSITEIDGLRIAQLPVSDPKKAILMLKRRHINPTNFPIHEDIFLLKQVPDVVLISGSHPVENYKGISIISIPPEKAVFLDLSDRQVIMEGQ